ncbi:hypothetical protein [Aneurinibacillus migulanus]|uniref:Uncharacterized protein n=1 Tax=Aneurinibacillus migulanus TaxID=47500 RepID=A0A1G8PL91_ANEMI|nr:hypothetical protein [Aneurinibacillus migulanus]MED0892825.1 hypothetical protein [Aneurinibacillus migulanus]MED1619071.1 hypothetical protein [Aneurinibacillus migulanus]GED14354.1 hypothetical protein AMI01nite_23450 [Aneurinibacillus migulanus]SDI93339.1 hypothetical protein SAMN04487909_109141 [Aneurinibacillus migulanus]
MDLEKRKRINKKIFTVFGIFIVLIIVLFALLPNDKSTTTEQTQGESKSERVMSESEIKRFNEYAPKLAGGTLIKEAKANDSVAEVVYADFEEHKKLHPKDKMTKQLFDDYWGTGDKINKVLMEEPLRLLREFPSLNDVKMTVNYNGKKYHVEVNRKTIEEYFNINLDEIHNDESLDKWRTKVVQVYFTKEEREKYVAKFIKTN